MELEKSKRKVGFSREQAMLIGIVLLIPLILVTSLTHLIPLSKVFAIAQTDGNILNNVGFIGNENYDKMAEDRGLQQAISNTIPYVMMRAVIASIIPVLVGGLIGSQARMGRIINRLLLSLIAVLIVPISIGALWSVYWGQNWGSDPSPIFDEAFSFVTRDGAIQSLQQLDTLMVVAIAAVVGGTVFVTVMRGHNRIWAGLGVGLIGVIIAGASGFLVFDMPMLLTAGGPGNSTTTIVLQIYNNGFLYFDFGYASALGTVLGLGAMLVGLIIGLISIGFRLRLIPLPSNYTSGQENNGFAVASIPIVLIILLPLIGLVLWGVNLATQYESFGQVSETADWTSAHIQSMTPWIAIWFIHLPITFMAGLALGFFRPFGKIGSNILFVVLLMITIVPTEVLMFEWFIQAREMGMLNNPTLIGLPWLVNGFSLLVFKVLFDGLYEHYYASLYEGEASQNVFVQRVILPGMLMAVTIGIILSFISSQSLLWSLVSQINRENFTSPLLLLSQIRMGFGTDTSFTAGAASQIVWQNFIIFLVLFGLLQVFVLERFKLEAGQPIDEESEENFIDDL